MRHGTVLMTAMVLALGPAVDGRADDVVAGRELYMRLCASCHGASGRGDGPVARALGQPPTDLTTFARDNGGNFPALVVFDAVDGSEMPRAHGVSEMPVWGEVLAGSPNSYEVIGLLTDYLRTIQRR